MASKVATRMPLKAAAEALSVTLVTLWRLRRRKVFTVLPRENANGSTSKKRRTYLLADEVEAYVLGGEVAVERLRTTEGRI